MRSKAERTLHVAVLISAVAILFTAAGEAAGPGKIHRIRDAAGGVYVGQMKDGRYHGKGAYTWPNGTWYSGRWLNGQRNGEGAMVWPNGMKYVGDWRNGERTGYGTLTWRDRTAYQGWWMNGRQSGKGTMSWADGRMYWGDFTNDRMDGGWLFANNGTVSWTRQRSGRAWEQKPLGPTDWRSFNNARWNDLSRHFTPGWPVVLRLDNRLPNLAELVLWAAYPGPQRFRTRICKAYGLANTWKQNQGRYVKLDAKLMLKPPKSARVRQLSAGLSMDGVSKELVERLLERGPYVYRIRLSVRDRGKHAAFVLLSDAAPFRVLARAKLDDGGKHASGAQCAVLAPPGKKLPGKPGDRPAIKGPGTLVRARVGGTITHKSGARLLIPAGALARDTKAHIQTGTNQQVALLPTTKIGETLYDITVTGQTKFGKPLTLVIPYTQADVARGAKEEDLQLAYRNRAGVWLNAGGTVDTRRKTITLRTSHLTSWATYCSTEDFTIIGARYKGISVEDAEEVLKVLKDIKKTLKDWGFKTHKYPPLEIYICEMGDDAAAEAKDSLLWGEYINLDKGLCRKPAKMKETLAHEYWHICQSAYFSGGMPGKLWWFAEATVAPIADHFSPGTDQFVGTMEDNYAQLFKPMGNHHHAEPKVLVLSGYEYKRRLNHGYGVQPFFIYLTTCGEFKLKHPAKLMHLFFKELGKRTSSTNPYTGMPVTVNCDEQAPLRAADAVIRDLTNQKKGLSDLYVRFAQDYWSRKANLLCRWSRASASQRYLKDPSGAAYSFNHGPYSMTACCFHQKAKTKTLPPAPLTVTVSGFDSEHHHVFLYRGESNGLGLPETCGLKKWDRCEELNQKRKSVTLSGFGKPVSEATINADALFAIVVNADPKKTFKGSITVGKVVATLANPDQYKYKGP